MKSHIFSPQYMHMLILTTPAFLVELLWGISPMGLYIALIHTMNFFDYYFGWFIILSNAKTILERIADLSPNNKQKNYLQVVKYYCNTSYQTTSTSGYCSFAACNYMQLSCPYHEYYHLRRRATTDHIFLSPYFF